MLHVTANGTGGSFTSSGVYNLESSPSMNNVTATGTGSSESNYGVYNNNSSPTIRGSSIRGTTNSVRNDISSAKIADTTRNGSVFGDGFTCVGVHNEFFVSLECG